MVNANDAHAPVDFFQIRLDPPGNSMNMDVYIFLMVLEKISST